MPLAKSLTARDRRVKVFDGFTPFANHEYQCRHHDDGMIGLPHRSAREMTRRTDNQGTKSRSGAGTFFSTNRLKLAPGLTISGSLAIAGYFSNNRF